MRGAVASAMETCMELENVPLSSDTMKQIFIQLIEESRGGQYRKLRLKNCTSTRQMKSNKANNLYEQIVRGKRSQICQTTIMQRYYHQQRICIEQLI
jgi:hypothetical protein